MSIKVLVPTAVLLSVAYVQATAQVTYAEPSASVAYVEASALANWVDVQVIAEVTMPDVLAVEIINPVDAVSKTTIKQFADSFGVSEDKLVQVVQKVFTEAVTPTDIVNILLVYQRTFADTFTALDNVTLGVTKNLEDLVANVDLLSFSTAKGFSDVVGMLDNMDTDIQYEIIKTISELIYTADAHIIQSILAKADLVTMDSSGSLLMQDYCDITYFLEDYVGTSRTFT
jgi:hypothetical protein